MYEYRATIVRWVDGDTVDLDIDLGFGIVYANQRVRLFGIDAFESRTRDLQEKQKGLAKTAKDFVERMPPNGFQVILRSKKDGKGKFGRILGEIIIDTPKGQQNLNTLLTIEGHAVRYEY